MTDPNTTDSARRTATRSKGELVFDVALVLAIGGYLIVAQTYPPIGRQIPTVVGIIALVAAAVQLVGWFVPGMWKFTHGEQADDGVARAGRTPPGDAQQAPPGDGRPVDVPVAMAWAAGFLGAILLFGYVVAVPLFFLVYFAVRRSWVLAIASAVVMGLVTSLLFERLLDIPMYGGLLF
jgi:hypothetical protein